MNEVIRYKQVKKNGPPGHNVEWRVLVVDRSIGHAYGVSLLQNA